MSDETKREQEFSDAPLYEIEGAIRSAVADAIAAGINWSAERQREQTAATILAALIQANDGRFTGDSGHVGVAVALADALRAELARKP
jgi:hypothetical protein